MGCCLSSSSSSNSPSPNRAPPPPPPPPLEEESVKEVLSETPKPKPKPKTLSNPNGGISIHPTQLTSDLSEVCSFTDTLSTTTVTDKMDDYQEISHRLSRSPAKLPNTRSLSDDWLPTRDRSVGKSPSRKSDHSPGRINGGALKLVHSRDMGPSLRPEPRLHNRTESPYRRSRSPATTRSNGVVSRTAAGRSPSVRRSGMSPGRDYHRKEAAQVKAAETNESLDNPLVSLECFIFL